MTNKLVHIATELANAAFLIGKCAAELHDEPGNYTIRAKLFFNRGRYDALSEVCALLGIEEATDWEKHPAYARGRNAHN